ncbi:hypothetical protein V6N13_090726 [Hibiscus sabdariffa]|uniref:SMP domain-containing protein n=2 Tax=Hibiscus sabdariffa TaxID=183260 RepID=A0ABR1ZF08_9ROSI
MQAVENSILGHSQKGCAAAVMQSAAMQNEKAGFVGRDDINAAEIGVTTKQTQLSGKHDRTVAGQYCHNAGNSGSEGGGDITIGEALEATSLTSGEKPVEPSDAAEVIVTGCNTIMPDSIAAAAQSAASLLRCYPQR